MTLYLVVYTVGLFWMTVRLFYVSLMDCRSDIVDLHAALRTEFGLSSVCSSVIISVFFTLLAFAWPATILVGFFSDISKMFQKGAGK